VNAAIVDPAFIARVRKKLALDQHEAAFDPEQPARIPVPAYCHKKL
jgi:hypothetical protein